MQVECRVILFTMPKRRRFKPRIDCVAILGKLSSLLVLWFAYKPNSYCLGLKSRLVAGYVYIPPQTPPLTKEGLVALFQSASSALGNLGKQGIVGNTCVICAILGKLSSLIVLWFTHKPNAYCLVLKSRLCRLCLHSSPNPSFDKGEACCKCATCELRSGYYG